MIRDKEILVIKANGERRELSVMPSFSEMQAIVGGPVELVRVLDRVEGTKLVLTYMAVNEDGLFTGLPRNDDATIFYQLLVRAQFPQAKNPFRVSKEAWLKQFPAGVTVLDSTPPEALANGYADDPWICGDVVLFAGYTCEELERMGI